MVGGSRGGGGAVSCAETFLASWLYLISWRAGVGLGEHSTGAAAIAGNQGHIVNL